MFLRASERSAQSIWACRRNVARYVPHSYVTLILVLFSQKTQERRKQGKQRQKENLEMLHLLYQDKDPANPTLEEFSIAKLWLKFTLAMCWILPYNYPFSLKWFLIKFKEKYIGRAFQEDLLSKQFKGVLSIHRPLVCMCDTHSLGRLWLCYFGSSAWERFACNFMFT